MNLRRNDSIVVTGLGMVSSIGLDVITSCASARAGLSRMSHSDVEILNEEELRMEPIRGHAINLITDGFTGLGRLANLGIFAFKDLLNYSKLTQKMLSKTGIYIHLRNSYYNTIFIEKDIISIIENDKSLTEEIREEFKEENFNFREHLKKNLIQKIIKYNKVEIPEQFHFYSFGGRADFINTIKQATDLLREKTIDRCIVGGIDSLTESTTVELLNELGLLHTPVNGQGFFPGEAAAFVLLERFESAKMRNAKIEGFIDSPKIGKASYHRFSEESPNGLVLSKTISQSFSNLCIPIQEVGLSIGNLNGDTWLAKEFGYALSQMNHSGLPVNYEIWSPAQHFGEIGAATGAAAICLGIRAFVGGYSKSNDILIWIVSENESQGAFFLRNFV